MLYYGGKSKISVDIVSTIERLTDVRTIYEPFCGGCSVTLTLALRGWTVYPSDFNAALVNCINKAIEGWLPETAPWEEALKLPDTDPRKAFTGIFCSYSGFWFKRFEPSLVPGSITTLRATASHLRRRGILLTHAHYLKAFEAIPDGSIVYCDPPYSSTKEGYENIFDHAMFVNDVKKLASRGCKVFISEYSAPCSDCREVWCKTHDRSFSGKRVKLFDKLFLLDI